MPLKNDSPDVGFMDYVQHHERTWGTESYKGRPGLADILSAPVVVFWKPEPKAESASRSPKDAERDERYVVSLHTDLHDIEEHFVRLIMRGNLISPRRRIVSIFQNQKRVRVKSVKVEFDQPEG